MPDGHLQDFRSSSHSSSSFQQTVRETAGHSSWGCSGGGISHTDSRVHHQGPDHQAVAKRLGERKLRVAAPTIHPHPRVHSTKASMESGAGGYFGTLLKKRPSAGTSCDRGILIVQTDNSVIVKPAFSSLTRIALQKISDCSLEDIG